MILFKKDWQEYPSAIVDYDTRNETFKRMVSVYREMGVENCLWPLALMQPELVGVDPHDESLDEITKVKIGLECSYNPWYFFREVMRIPQPGSTKPSMFRADRGNLAMYWSFFNNMDLALIQPRQTGKSVGVDALMNWILYIGTTNSLVTMITKDHDLRTKNIERLKKIRDSLPKFLTKVTKQDSDNQVNLTCIALGNSYLSGVAQNSESAANNLGRGLTSPIIHVDEGPFIKFIGTTMAALLASGTAARESARENNRPYGNIFTTTAGKRDDRDGKYMYDLIHGGAVWNEIFFDAHNKENFHELVKNSRSGRKSLVNITMSHRQLGKTDEWLYQTISDVNATGEEADRDFFNIWTSGTQSSPLTTAVNTVIKESEKEPVRMEITSDNYIIRWYVEEEELAIINRDSHIVIGLDTSDAIGRDSLAMVMVDIRDLSVVGAATINETNLIRFSKFLADILIAIPNSTLVPERKSSAQSIIDALIIHLSAINIDPFKRIYNVVADNHYERRKDYEQLLIPMSRRNNQFYDKWKKTAGFVTTGQSRDLLYSTVLQNAAKNAGHLVHDRVISEEIRGLVTKNGRIDHSSDSHDDMVIAWLLACWFVTQSKNLEFYGISTNTALSKVYGTSKKLTEEELWELDEQRKIKEEIESIYETLGETTDEFMIARYESRLRSLSMKVKEGDFDITTIDGLIKEAEEKRLQAMRKRKIQQRYNSFKGRK